MANWTTNPIMEWSTDEGTTWSKISDHGRAPLGISVERIEGKQRMANGTLRRYVIAKKKSWSINWSNIPNVASTFLANGQSGEWMENFHNTVDGDFLMRIRKGSDQGTTFTGMNGEVYRVMITSFSKEVTKRGASFDLLDIDISLEEV